MWPQLMGEILLPLFPAFRTYKRGKTVKSNSYVLTLLPSPPQKKKKIKNHPFMPFFFLHCEGTSILLPNVILWGWSFRLLSHSWPVTRCGPGTLLDPALTLHWQPEKCPPHLWVWRRMPWYSCLPGHGLLSGDPASSSCRSHPLLPIRTGF